MKSKISCGIIAAAAVLTSSNTFATIIGTGSLTISAPGFTSANNNDQAGPYTVSITSPAGVVPIDFGSFNTFCIGTKVDYTPGSYTYEISDIVQPPGVAPGFVTWGAAYLYSQYRANIIGDKGANDATDDALQAAIWTLQSQDFTSGITFGPGGAPTSTEIAVFTDLAAKAAMNAGISNDKNASDGAFGVYALDMKSGSTYVQPQLVLVPVPEPTTVIAGASLLLPFGASAMRKLRKNRTA